MQLNLHNHGDLEGAKAWAVKQIDGAAGRARTRYLTVAEGQESTYQAKYADALAFVRAGCPSEQIDAYPWVKVEAEATGVAYAAAAAGIKAKGDPWHMDTGPKIEGLRIGGKRALEDLTDIGAVVAHARAVGKQLDAV